MPQKRQKTLSCSSLEVYRRAQKGRRRVHGWQQRAGNSVLGEKFEKFRDCSCNKANRFSKGFPYYFQQVFQQPEEREGRFEGETVLKSSFSRRTFARLVGAAAGSASVPSFATAAETALTGTSTGRMIFPQGFMWG